MTRPITLSYLTPSQRLYALQDANYNVTALVSPIASTSYSAAAAVANVAGFGAGGHATTSVAPDGGGATSVLVQSNGDIIAAGAAYDGDNAYATLVRYHSNGQRDTNFGTSGNGIVLTSLYGGSSAQQIVKYGADHFLTVGTGGDDDGSFGVVAMYNNSDGSLDGDFGTGGTATVRIADCFVANSAVVRQSDNEIVLGGMAVDGNGHMDFALACLLADGSGLDTNFGTNSDGVVLTYFGDGGDDTLNKLVLLNSDKILAVGGTGTSPKWALAQYNADGTLDTSFGTSASGRKLIDMGHHNGDTITAAAVTGSGTNESIYVAGPTNAHKLTAVRLQYNGAVDTTFGVSGTASADFNVFFAPAAASDIAVDGDGNVVVAGTAQALGAVPEAAIARFTSSGALDAGFGYQGKLADTITGNATVTALALTAGHIVIAGCDGNNQFLVGEYDPAQTVSSTTPQTYTVALRFVDDPYGQSQVLNANWTAANATFGCDANGWVYGFQGMRFDTVSASYVADYRVYRPSSGTWTQQDPAAVGMNLYEFSGGNPVNYTDPSGLCQGGAQPDAAAAVVPKDWLQDRFELGPTGIGGLSTTPSVPANKRPNDFVLHVLTPMQGAVAVPFDFGLSVVNQFPQGESLLGSGVKSLFDQAKDAMLSAMADSSSLNTRIDGLIMSSYLSNGGQGAVDRSLKITTLSLLPQNADNTAKLIVLQQQPLSSPSVSAAHPTITILGDTMQNIGFDVKLQSLGNALKDPLVPFKQVDVGATTTFSGNAVTVRGGLLWDQDVQSQKWNNPNVFGTLQWNWLRSNSGSGFFRVEAQTTHNLPAGSDQFLRVNVGFAY